MITLPSYHSIRPYYIIREETTYTYDKDDKASDTGLSSLDFSERESRDEKMFVSPSVTIMTMPVHLIVIFSFCFFFFFLLFSILLDLMFAMPISQREQDDGKEEKEEKIKWNCTIIGTNVFSSSLSLSSIFSSLRPTFFRSMFGSCVRPCN